MRRKPNLVLRLLVPALVALLPMLTLAGGAATPAQAGTPATLPAAQEDGSNLYILEVYFRNNAERDQLATDFGAEEVPTTGGFLTFIGDNDTLNSLKARGLRVEINERKTAGLRSYLDPDQYETFYGGYKTVEEIYAFLDEKVAAYPTLAEKVDVGDSWCKAHPGQCIRPQPNNGYDLYAMRITNRNIPGPKPVTWIDAGIHSREIATPEVAMRYIAYLLDNYQNNADARWLVDWHEIWVMPTFNPDGHHIVEAGGNSPYLYRKNGNNTAGACSWPPTSSNHHGVDNNRNFPFKWGCCGGSSTQPCSQTYRGVSGDSEDETAAVTAKIRQLIPDQRGPLDTDMAPITTTGVYQNIHTVVPINLIPWGWTFNSAPNDTDLRNIARHVSSPQMQPPGNNYPYDSISQGLYVVDGGSIDWAYGELGAASISTELSGGNFLPPYTCIDNPGCDSAVGIWPENRGMLLHISKIARTPYLTTRGPDANSVATNPMTATQGSPVQLSATINYNWRGADGVVNAYVQNAAAAEYYIGTPPWAGGVAMPMQATDGAFDEQTEDVQATIDTSVVPPGTYVVYVRGRGVNSYSGYESWGPVSAAFMTVTGGATPTVTMVPATSTSIPSATRTATTVPSTATTVATATTCTVTFTDVPPTDPFWTNIRCLACRGIVSGYNDGTFRPYNNITRGQIAKIVSNAAGFSEPVSGQRYEDVLPTNTFYEWIERLSQRGHMGGYPCGERGSEPCIQPDNRPYFRPTEDATRGQLSKIVSNAAGISDPVSGVFYADVDESNPFYVEIMRLTNRGVMSGYPCGGAGEPCDGQNRPYFRWGNPVTRGQASKIVANTFYPNCATP
jgi:carboxypeptidase T